MRIYHYHRVVTQVVYISKTLSVQGGYTLTSGITRPGCQPYDGRGGQGRVVQIFQGNISLTITGLNITDGDVTGFAGLFADGGGEWNTGGGTYIHGAAATISDSLIYSNTSPDIGGGVFIGNSTAWFHKNIFHHNQTRDEGGGLFLYHSHSLIKENDIYLNSTQHYGNGGGLSSFRARTP